MQQSLAGACALVTGASGFIGQHLCSRLSAVGVSVIAVTRSDVTGAPPKPMSWRRCDLTDATAVVGLVVETKPDLVFHLASHVTGDPRIELVLPTFHANLQTTVNLLAACTAVKCKRVVLTGSLVEPDVGSSERIPSSPYAAAKWASADYGRMFWHLYSVPVCIARVFMVYGPTQRDRSKLVPYTIESLVSGSPPRISSGERLIDWIYVDDVVAGMLALAAAAADVDGATIDLGSGTTIRTRDLVLRIASLMNSPIAPQFGVLPARPMEPIRVASVQESFRRIGWRPQTDLDNGLRRTIEWFTRNNSVVD